MVGDFGWEHEGTKSGVGTVKIKSNLVKYKKKVGKFQNNLYCLQGNRNKDVLPK